MNIILNIYHWVNLSAEVRQRIRVLFNIPRSSNTVVNDGKLETDGTTVEDFKALTLDKMQTFLGSTLTDFHKLFDLVVARVMDDIALGKLSAFPTHVESVISKAEEIINAKPKSNGKKKQK